MNFYLLVRILIKMADDLKWRDAAKIQTIKLREIKNIRYLLFMPILNEKQLPLYFILTLT